MLTNWHLIRLVAIVGTIVIQGGGTIILAQTNAPNPLETPIESPLIPKLDRPLTPFEQRRLREALDQINVEAQAKLAAGKDEEAFALWYREIKLRRYLGTLDEVQALGRVGAVAWEKSRTADVKIIRQRLQMIQQEVEANRALTPELLTAFAQSYDQIRSIDDSLYIYQIILSNQRTAGDTIALEATLNRIGELHLARFDYFRAAPIYEELLTMARARADSLREGIYLQKLAEIYKESLQPQNAVRIKEELAENYLRTQQIQLIPPLKILIGSDYQTLNQAELASQNYQEAYSLAWALQQFGTAGEALTKLAELYQSKQQIDYALILYQELIKIEQLSYNYYGLMNTYERIGQIYLERKNYPQAISAFQNALELARAIRYKEDYFLAKIAQVNQQMNPPPEPNPTPGTPQ